MTSVPDEQLSLDRANARTSDPSTSKLAAVSVSKLTDKRAAVLGILRDHVSGLTDEQIAAVYRDRTELRGVPPQSESGLRTRRKELVTLDLVHDTGGRSRMKTGRMAIVWAAGARPTRREADATADRELWIVHPPHRYLPADDLPGWENKCGMCSQTEEAGDHSPDGGTLHTRRIDPRNYRDYPTKLMSMLTGIQDLRSLTLETEDGQTVRYEWRTP